MTAGGIVELPGMLVDRPARDAMQKHLPGIDDGMIVSAVESTTE